MPPSRRVRVIAAQPGSTVEVAPGQAIVPLPPDDVQTVALAELVPAGNGTFRQIARICPRWFKVTRAELERLHIPISEMTMRRLITAGFVRGCAVTPWVMQFDLYSYLAHVEAVVRDPEFWSNKEPGHRFTNLERYQQTL